MALIKCLRPMRRMQPYKLLNAKYFRVLILAVACQLGSDLIAQDFALPLDDFSRMQLLRTDQHRQQSVHSGILPALTGTIDGFDHSKTLERDTLRSRSWLHRKLFHEHFVVVDQPGLQFVLDPIFNFTVGGEQSREGFSDVDANPLYINSRGFALSAKVGDAVYIYSDFTENQARFPAYLTRFVNDYSVVPGNGRIKPFGEGGFDYNMASGFIGVNATDWLILQAGHSKQFVGHGRRSILLSDNVFNQPFAAYNISLWEGRVQFRNNIALLQSLERLPLGATPESLFQRKYMSYNYLSIKPVQSFEIGFYEAVQWQYFVEGQGPIAFNYNALNPVIFVNTLRLGLDDANNNAMVGLNAAWQPIDHVRLYGQWMRDRGGDSKGAYQLGVHAYGLLDRIDVRLEYNEVEMGSYASANALQGFHHFNQAMAHPLGSGFRETMGVITYYHKHIFVQAEWIVASLDEGLRNPVPVAQSEVLPAKDLFFQDYQVAYIFNEKNHMQIFAGFTDRFATLNELDKQNQFWYFGLRSRLNQMTRNF